MSSRCAAADVHSGHKTTPKIIPYFPTQKKKWFCWRALADNKHLPIILQVVYQILVFKNTGWPNKCFLFKVGLISESFSLWHKSIKTSTKGISSIKPEMGILIIYSYSVIDVRTWWFGWVQEIQEAIFKREHSSSALLLICNKHSWDTIAAKIKSYKVWIPSMYLYFTVKILIHLYITWIERFNLSADVY